MNLQSDIQMLHKKVNSILESNKELLKSGNYWLSYEYLKWNQNPAIREAAERLRVFNNNQVNQERSII